MQNIVVACFFGALAVTLALAQPAENDAKIKPIPPPELICGPNEVTTSCYNDCQKTCKNRIKGSGRVCTAACTKVGCVCETGYLRHDNGTCIPVDQCSPPDCGPGEVYNNCGSACPATCQNRGRTCQVCTLQCVDGCFCGPKTIRAPDGSCVAPKDCPPRTCSGPNEEFVECPPTCPKTEKCENLWIKQVCEPTGCCTPQCRCKSGFFRDGKNICVSAKQCMVQAKGTEASAQAVSQPVESTAEASS